MVGLSMLLALGLVALLAGPLGGPVGAAVPMPPSAPALPAAPRPLSLADREGLPSPLGDSDDVDEDAFLSHILNAQAHVLAHSFPVRTIVCVRFRTASVIATITAHAQRHGSREEQSNDPLVLRAPRFLAFFVGRQVDCAELRRRCQRASMSPSCHDALSARGLALQLADLAHRASLRPSQRPLAANALVLCRRTGELLSVDASANYHFVRAGALGHLSGELNQWLDGEGRALAARLQGAGADADDTRHALTVLWTALASQPALMQRLHAGNASVHITSWQGNDKGPVLVPSALAVDVADADALYAWWTAATQVPTPSERNSSRPRWFKVPF